ncbi:MAG: 5-formyltetrahydrofolate cyclo-ligase [Thermoflexales bacterium]|nr:5-formyltetrahydrofolate cyclo-ligase [Thermoflexales bacterium]
MTKALVRAGCRRIREALTPAQVATSSAQVCAHLAAWPPFQLAQRVLAYLAFRNEIGLAALLAEFPAKQWVVPRTVVRPEPHLVLHAYDPARLVRHPFGMLEPESELPIIQSAELDLVLAPGLAYDRRGYRLGLGGGFYDRLLPGISAPKVGIVYEALIVEAVPAEPHDQRVDYLACESGICPADSKQNT